MFVITTLYILSKVPHCVGFLANLKFHEDVYNRKSNKIRILYNISLYKFRFKQGFIVYQLDKKYDLAKGGIVKFKNGNVMVLPNELVHEVIRYHNCVLIDEDLHILGDSSTIMARFGVPHSGISWRLSGNQVAR